MDKVKPEAFSSESDLYFDVWERPAFFAGRGPDAKYFEDTNHKHIVRLENDTPISIGLVGANYKLLKNRELYEGIEEAFMECLTDEELHGVTRRDRTSYMGGTSIRDYVFPSIRVDIGSDKSNIAFRVIVINGYDGSSSFRLYHGAIDFFCTNGMVTGAYNMIIKRHTSGLTLPNIADNIRKSIDQFVRQGKEWARWVQIQVGNAEVLECYKAIHGISTRRVEQLMVQYDIERDTHGSTVWAMYSAATYYASQDSGVFAIRETASDHKASTLLNREQQINLWLTTDEFKKLSHHNLQGDEHATV